MDLWSRLLGDAPLLRPAEAARRLGISPRTLEAWRLSGRVAYRKVGRLVWLEADSLVQHLRFVEQRRAGDGELIAALRGTRKPRLSAAGRNAG